MARLRKEIQRVMRKYKVFLLGFMLALVSVLLIRYAFSSADELGDIILLLSVVIGIIYMYDYLGGIRITHLKTVISAILYTSFYIIEQVGGFLNFAFAPFYSAELSISGQSIPQVQAASYGLVALIFLGIVTFWFALKLSNKL